MAVDWDTVWASAWIGAVISAGFSAIVGLTIAFYVKNRFKPKQEQVFDKNRKKNIQLMFNDLESFHYHADFIFMMFEREFGELKVEREKLIEGMTWYSSEEELRKSTPFNFKKYIKQKDALEDLKKALSTNHNLMKKTEEFHTQQINFSERYFEYEFLHQIRMWMFHTSYYIEQLFKGELASYSLQMAGKSAKKIIDYLKKDGELDLEFPSIKKFINRWESYFKDVANQRKKEES